MRWGSSALLVLAPSILLSACLGPRNDQVDRGGVSSTPPTATQETAFNEFSLEEQNDVVGNVQKNWSWNVQYSPVKAYWVNFTISGRAAGGQYSMAGYYVTLMDPGGKTPVNRSGGAVSAMGSERLVHEYGSGNLAVGQWRLIFHADVADARYHAQVHIRE